MFTASWVQLELLVCDRPILLNVITNKGPVNLILRVKIAHLFLQFVSNLFHFIILSLPFRVVLDDLEIALIHFQHEKNMPNFHSHLTFSA